MKKVNLIEKEGKPTTELVAGTIAQRESTKADSHATCSNDRMVEAIYDRIVVEVGSEGGQCFEENGLQPIP
jgi:hypothetical protein